MQMIKKIILLLILTILCSSCAKVEYQMEINKDGSGNFTYLLQANKEEFEPYKEKYNAIIENAKIVLEQSGFSVNTYNDDKEVKFEAKIYIDDVKKIDEFATLLKPAIEGTPTISYSKNLFGEKYEINGVIDLTSYSDTKADLEKDELIMNNLDISFKMKIPAVSQTNNANEINEKELTWDLKYNQENIITVRYENPNYVSIITICVILFIGVQFIAIKIVKKIIIIRDKRKSINKIEE